MDMQKVKICPVCGKEHTRRRAICCCIEHGQLLSKQHHIRKAIIEKVCPKCGTTHTKRGIFCSRQCANSHVHTEESRKKTSESLKKYHERNGNNPTNKIHICPVCKTEFLGPRKQVCCSNKCSAEKNKKLRIESLMRGLETMKRNGNLGGYREGSGRSKHGYYKGIYCGSSYELVWLVYQLDNGLDVKRFEGELEWNGVKYIPDFLQNGKIIELKGYEPEDSVNRKTQVAKHFGYDVIVKRKQDLTKEFEWVKTHYTFKDLEELYDDYHPKYTYTCSMCGKDFTRNRKANVEHPCCSRKCAGNLLNKNR